MNNFVIVGVSNETLSEIAKQITSSTSLKVKEVIYPSIKILLGFQDAECMRSNEDYTIFFNGVFLGETPTSLFSSIINNFEDFVRDYQHQGVLALINAREEVIKVVGDPASTRTIFYLTTPKMFIISTDMELLKSIAKILDIQLEADILAIYEIILLGSIVSRRTMYKKVERLLPGEYIVVKPAENSTLEFAVKRYWDVSSTITEYKEDKGAIISLVKTMNVQLKQFCEETDGSEVVIPISGGIDSTLLLLLATKAEKCSHIHAVHVNLGVYQELLFSRLVATIFKVPYTYSVLSNTLLNNTYIQMLSRLLRIIGYPREGDASLPYLILAQHIKGVRFSLGGDDSDSIFGGYDYYKYFGAQLIMEEKIGKLVKLLRILRKYNYNREKLASTICKIIRQAIFRYHPLRYFYFKLYLRKILTPKGKRLGKKIAQYLAEVSRELYEGPPQRYYHHILAKIPTYKTSHLVHTRVKADEYHEIIVYLPFATRKILEIIMKIPAEYFFFPIGSRSLARLLLKYFGVPPAIYLQLKSGFSLTEQALKDSRILQHIIERVKNCWVSEYINVNKLTPLQIHSIYNVCELTS
ncbi:MAG: asparagine synthase-related protein [Thermosphaera sp.]